MVKSINFDWRFKDDFKETYLEKTPLDALKIDIPHSIKVLPSNYFNEKDFEKVTTYFKTFDLEDYENKSFPSESLLSVFLFSDVSASAVSVGELSLVSG